MNFYFLNPLEPGDAAFVVTAPGFERLYRIRPPLADQMRTEFARSNGANSKPVKLGAPHLKHLTYLDEATVKPLAAHLDAFKTTMVMAPRTLQYLLGETAFELLIHRATTAESRFFLTGAVDIQLDIDLERSAARFAPIETRPSPVVQLVGAPLPALARVELQSASPVPHSDQPRSQRSQADPVAEYAVPNLPDETDSAAIAMLKAKAQDRIEQDFYDSVQLARARKVGRKYPQQNAQNLRARNRIFGVLLNQDSSDPTATERFWPRLQFDDKTSEPLVGMYAILREVPERKRGWPLLVWCETENPMLEGKTPAEWIRNPALTSDSRARVAAAARASFGQFRVVLDATENGPPQGATGAVVDPSEREAKAA